MRAAIGLLALLLCPALLGAQDDAPAPQVGSMLRLASANDVVVTLGGYLQVDGRWLSGATQPLPDGVLLRRARLIVDAELPAGWLIRLQPDFGQGRVLVQDAFVGYARSGVLARAGRFRPNYGLERMQSSSTLLFPERSLINSLVPSRTFGAQLRVERGPWTLSTGGFRTPIGTDAAAIDTDGDVEATVGSGHDVLLRLAWARRVGDRYADIQGSWLDGRERGSLDSPAMTRILTVGQQPVVAFRNDGSIAGTVVAAGPRRRASVGAIAGSERGMLALEGGMLRQRGVRDGAAGDITAMGWVLRANRVVQGRQLPNQEIIPSHPRGAFEYGLRGGVLGIWGDGTSTLLSGRSARRAMSVGIAAAWIPTTLTRLSLAYDITGTARFATIREHALMLRVQQGF